MREREMMYRLIVSQLRYDGYEEAATAVGHVISSYPPTAPSSRLQHLVQLGQKTEGEAASNQEVADMLPHLRGQGTLDLEYEADEELATPPGAKYDLTYSTTHKGASLVASFSLDGRLAATGSSDSSIKVLDVERMMSKTALGHQQDLHPVIRTLYDHNGEVLALDFHPTVSVLASGSTDCLVKFFDYSKPAVKRSYCAIQEVAAVQCISFHPSGDYLLVGTEQSTLRLYDVNTLQCFVSSDARDQHWAVITSVQYSPDGRLYTTASEDGSIKIWDGVSNRCINTFNEAHTKEHVTSVLFSKNSKYILSCGKDGNAALWELAMGRPLNTYQPSTSHKLDYCPRAVFNHTEDYVLMGEDKGQQQVVLSWDARTSQPHLPLITGHLATVQYVAHSPTAPALISCSNDQRIRFFFHREQ